jgi:hypothetical protein
MRIQEFHEVVAILERATPLGVRSLDNGTKLIGHVPHVAPQAWLHVMFSPLNEEQVCNLEQTLQRNIPPDYREFLLSFGNGLCAFSDNLSLYGLQLISRSGDNMWQPFPLDTPNFYERPPDASEQAFFIGGYEQDGSLLYLEKGQVFRCNRNAATPLNKWPSFKEMLVAEVKRISTLFDDEGRLKDADAITTPSPR